MDISYGSNTGEILGMSSRPNFNPNNYKDYSTEVINRNMAIWASYEPGSTFKILTVSAAVNEGKVDLLKDTFTMVVLLMLMVLGLSAGRLVDMELKLS